MNRSRGFSLIELMVVVAIAVILTLVALPGMGDWLQNSRMRSAAESMGNGLRFAQAEAIRLSRQTAFVATSTGWTVSYIQVVAAADSATGLPLVLQTSPSVENVTITQGSGTPAVLAFNSLGRVGGASSLAGPFPAITADAIYNIASSSGSRHMRLIVSPAGKVRICDPDKSFSTTNPDGC